MTRPPLKLIVGTITPPEILVSDGTLISIEITLNGGKQGDLRGWEPATDRTLLTDTADIVRAKERERIVAALPVEYREEAAARLQDLSERIIVRRQNDGGSSPQNKPATLSVMWPDPVDGESLLADIEAGLRRFVVLHRREHYTAVTLWTAFAHAHDAFRFSPILIATSPEKGSGKTRLLEILSELTPRPWLTSSPRDAVVFRKIDKVCPTFLLDEGDNVEWRERKELLSIFNAGYQRRTATIPRCVGEGASLDVRDFSTWCPKALSCLKVPFPDTTVSRSIMIRLKKKTRAEPLEELRERTAIAVFSPLRRQAARWAADNIDALRSAEPVVPEGLTDRTADVWEPLLAIADLVGGEWPERVRVAALYFGGNGAGDAESAGVMLLSDLRDLFADRATDRLSSKEILEDLTGRDDRPWSEWSGGRPLTARGLAKLLKPFGITPGTARSGEKTFKGYLEGDFEDAWVRYLPILSVTSVTSLPDNKLDDDLSVTPNHRVTDSLAANSMHHNNVPDVTDKIPLPGGETGREVLI